MGSSAARAGSAASAGETENFWSPFSQTVLKDIARQQPRALSVSKALTNLQECLSVCLWCYNAKIILQRLATCISNDMGFWDFMG